MLLSFAGSCLARQASRAMLRALIVLALTASFSATAFAQFTIALDPGSPLPPGTDGTPYSVTISAYGGTAPYTFAVTSGSLPAGLTLSSAGVLSGTPTTPGSSTFVIEATDSGAQTGFRTYNLNVGTPGGIGMSPSPLPDGSQGVFYNQTITGTGGTGPYTFSVTSGSLPTGLSLSSAGVLSGTPTVAGPFTFTVGNADSVGNTGSQIYTVNIGANILVVNPTTLANGALATPYNQTVTATNGTGPYTFSLASGTMPTGLSINSAGNITGTPSVAGPFSFTIRAIDSVNNTGTRLYNVNIGANILTVTPPTLPNGTRGQAYGATFGATGGTGSYTFAVTSGALPTGLTLNSNGTLSGTPSAAGTFNFNVQATDSGFNTGTGSYSVTINPAPLTINPASLPNGTVGTAYNQTVVASGGIAPYGYSIISGTLPTGLAINPSSGAITGTPTTLGSYNFTVQAADATPITGTRNYTVLIGTNILTIAPSTVPSGTRGMAYNQTLTASGGTGPYTYAVTSGALPAGLSLSAAGVISGTPSGSGVSSFTIGATDSVANTGSQNYTLSIGTDSLTVNPASLPAPVAGRPYSQSVSATGGTAPYTFSIAAGALPAGLTLNATTGLISGTPTGFATASFTVQALDINGNIGTRAYTLTTRPDPALDPEVRGLVSAQIAATRRFASAQIDNVGQHLIGLHDGFNPCAVNFGIAPPIDRSAPSGYQLFGAPNDQAYGQAYGYGPYGNSPAAPPRSRPGSSDCGSDWASSMALWTAGSFQFGSANPNSGSANNKFSTGGLTAGLDWRVTDGIIFGAALGYGADRTDVGQNGTRSNATNLSGTLYASLRPFNPLFLDFAIGYGTLDFDNRRYVTGDGTSVSGTRKGSLWFGSATASLELGRDWFKFAPYLKADFAAATLDQYAESGSSAQLLTFGEMKTNSTSVGLGLRGSIDLPMSFGTLTPTARIEYREISQSEYSQSMYYTDLGPGMNSAFGQPASVHGVTTAALGLRARAPGGLSVDLEYGVAVGNDAYKAQSIRGAVRLPF